TGPLAQAVGWALLHLVWQGALVAALLAVALSVISGRRAAVRYALSCGALALIVALGVATAIRCFPEATTAAAPGATSCAGAALGRGLPAAALAFARPDRLRELERAASDALPLIVTLWLCGVAILSARLILAWLGARRLVARSDALVREPWPAAMRRLSL